MNEPSNDLDLGGNTLLAHERMDVYRLAKELDLVVVTVSKRAGRGQGWLVDQVQRAAGSTVLNIAEANGRAGADRLQHLRIAKGSALETDSALDLFLHRGLIKTEERTRAHALAVRVVQMLSAMLRPG